MIKSLRIKNFVLVKDLEIDLGYGLNVLTGETGAGKSVIIGALDMILGQRAKGDVFLDKAQPVYLEAVFSVKGEKRKYLQKLLEDYLADDEDELIFVREILPDGSNRTFINGKRVSLIFIKDIRDELIDFHNQRDQVKLFSNQYQLEIIDTYGNLKEKRDKYSELYDSIKKLFKRLSDLEEEEKRSLERKRLYEYQINELEEINLQVGEDKELQSALDLFTHSEDILNDCGEIQQVFFENELSILDQIKNYRLKLERYGEDIALIKEVTQQFVEATHSLNEIQQGINRIISSVELDRGKMEETESRLNTILRIKEKYKMDLPEILDYLEEMKKSVENYNSAVEEMDKIKDTVKIQNKELLTQAEQLSLDRKRVSEQLKQDILDGVYKLAMPNGDFDVEFMSLEANKIVGQNGFPSGLNESGMDRIEFLFSANRGVNMQPLKNSISGGELSRLLLVLKKTLAGKLDTLSLIFDEIDSGIGGVTAKRTGEFISEVAKHHQVICITHLPQIAAVESKHFFIEKVVVDDKTVINIRELSQSERKDEIARMLSGEKSTTALKHAEELLNIK